MDHLRQFLAACGDGDVGWAEFALTEGRVQVDDCDDDGITGLQMASANGHEDLVRMLIMKGAALEKCNNYGWTALLHAARYGHTGVVSILLQNNSEINVKSRLGTNALTYAVKGGHLKTARLLLEAGCEFDTVASPCELSAMFVASLLGHDAIVRLLSDKGWDINQRMPSTFMTPLMCAAINGHMTTAQNLMERGCDPNLTDVNDKTALQLASDRGKREVKGFLDRKTNGKLPIVQEEDMRNDIIEATKNGDLSRVREILSEDASQKDFAHAQDGATALMFAAMAGRLDIATMLVECGCDIDKQDKISNWTALMQAIFHGKTNVAKFLINNGANVSLAAKNGITAFDMASFIDDVDTELLRLLAAKALNHKSSKRSERSSKRSSSSNSSESFDGGTRWWNKLSLRFKNLTKTFQSKGMKLSSGSGEKRKVKMSKMNSASTFDLPKMPLSPQGQAASFMDKRKSASLYHLNNLLPHAVTSRPLALSGVGGGSADTLKPVLPPFLPQPAFDLTAEMWTVPPHQKQLGSSTLDRTVNNKHPMIRPTSVRVGREGAVSPSSENRFSYGSPSPESSGGASSISGVFSAPTSGSSATSSTLTPGGQDRFHRRGTVDDIPFVRPPSFLLNSSQKYSSLPRLYSSSSSGFSPNSSGSSNSLSNKRPRTVKPRSSASPNLTAHKAKVVESTSSGMLDCLALSSSSHRGVIVEQDSEQDDAVDMEIRAEVSTILKELSLEKYQPIFEKEEVDMEAFLMLNETDLCELGITHHDSRRQILSAISDLSSAKNVQRRHSDLTNGIEATIRVRNSVHSDSTDLEEWFLHDSANMSENRPNVLQS